MTLPTDIRLMRDADLSRCDLLRRIAGWNQTTEDWRRFLHLSPNGCFVAEANDGVVGAVTTISYHGEIGWIGMLLVHPEMRGRGVGKALLTRAIEHLAEERIDCIKLDATAAGLPLYEKIGFQLEGQLQRLKSENKTSLSTLQRTFPMSSLTEADESSVSALDAQAFGVLRSELIRSLLASARIAVGIKDAGRLIGFALLSAGANADYIGPAVAHSEEMAEVLIHELIARSDQRPIYWDVPCANSTALKLAAHFGFSPERTLIRMFLGSRNRAGEMSRSLAIADPSLG